MKPFLKYILLILGSSLLFFGCKKTDLITYEKPNSVYFSWMTNPAYDTLRVNFALEGVINEKVIPFWVMLLGKPIAVEKAFNLVVDDQLSTAVAGVDYAFDEQENLSMAVDSISKQLRVKILRRTGLKNQSLKLVLRLVPNENFQVNKDLYASSNYNVKSGGALLEILIQDLLLKPASWDANENLLGKYSRTKLELFVQIRRLNLGAFYGKASQYAQNVLTTNARNFQTYLKEQKQAGNIILDEDGTEMKMGPAAQ